MRAQIVGASIFDGLFGMLRHWERVLFGGLSFVVFHLFGACA